jgi:putative DNA primase/helicase
MRKAATATTGVLQGREIELDDPEPWPEKVDGAELLDEVERQIKRFVILPDSSVVPFTLWCAITYVTNDLDVLPMLVFSSPVKRSGKTTALEVLSRLVKKPLASSTITPAALFRVVEKAQPTLIMDEADSAFRDNEDLRCLVNASFTRTAAYSIRCVGDNQEPRQFSTWCPKALALIGELPGTLSDRSLIIHMRRKGVAEQVERLRADTDFGFLDLRSKLARLAIDTRMARRASDPAVPGELNDRAADCWRELLKIAEAAGGTWPARARAAALLADDGDEEDAKVQLLADIKDFFDDLDDPRQEPSAEIVNHLVGLEGRPWAEWKKGKPLSTAGLGHLLYGFGIKSKDAKVAGKTRKVYSAADFADVYARYLPNKRNPQPTGINAIQDKDLQGCGGVAVADVKRNQSLAGMDTLGSSCGCKAQPQPYLQPSNTIPKNELSSESCGLRMNPGSSDTIQKPELDAAGYATEIF